MSSAQEDKSDVADTQSSPTGPAPANALAEAAAQIARPDAAESKSRTSWSPAHGLNVRYAGRSAVGLVREHNEDNFVIANLTTGEHAGREASLTDVVGEGGLLFAVCDGMGGAAAGEVASQMAVDVLQEAMRRGGFPAERDVLARRLVAAVEEAGRRIFDSAQKERSRRGMGTTATAAVLIDKVLFVAEVGDSRAYLLRAGELKQLTKDQSLVNQLIEAGHLTEAEAEAFEHSNIILQALGTSETVQVDLTFVELRRGDRLMLCSDGLSGLVHGDTLRDTLAGVDDPAECTGALVKFAEAGGGHDNITVVVIDFDGDALDVPKENDSFGYLQYPLVPSGTVAGAFSDEEITEAGKPASGRMSFESLPPLEPAFEPGVDSNPWLWISAGLVALLAGAWLLAASGGAGSVTADEAAPERAVEPAALPPPENKPELVVEQKVPVRVFSDVADAVLIVNGEARGPLLGSEGQTVELVPGAYRFEAQSHGNSAAVEVVTVRADGPAPQEVHLKLPAGATEPSGTVARPATPAAAEAPSVAAKAPAEAAPAAQAAAPSEPAAPAQAPAVAAKPSEPAAAPAGTEPEKPKRLAAAKPKKKAAEPSTVDAQPPAAAEPAAPQAPPPPPPKPASPIPDNPF